jgi:glycosyltransferase involved in cell wall biosynthesis
MVSTGVVEQTFGDVTIIIPHISTPTREAMLARAVNSIKRQTVQPREVFVMHDTEHEGASILRNRMLTEVQTKWVAFLDDDDELLPSHLATLLNYARNDDYDVLYPGCRVYDHRGLEIPRRMEWGRFLQPFDAELLRLTSYIPVTSLVRTELAQRSEFKPPQNSIYDDWGFYLKLLDMGARFKHVPQITWNWHHHGHNSSGLASRVAW